MSTAKIVLFHQGSTELRRCENCIFFLPVNILTGVACRLLGPHDTLPCVLIIIIISAIIAKTCDTTAWKSYPSKKVQDLVFENTKSCEIKSGGQDMAAMMLMLKKNFNNGCVHC